MSAMLFELENSSKVSFEASKALCELGYDLDNRIEPVYDKDGNVVDYKDLDDFVIGHDFFPRIDIFLALRWLEVNKNLFIVVHPRFGSDFDWSVVRADCGEDVVGFAKRLAHTTQDAFNDAICGVCEILNNKPREERNYIN